MYGSCMRQCHNQQSNAQLTTGPALAMLNKQNKIKKTESIMCHTSLESLDCDTDKTCRKAMKSCRHPEKALQLLHIPMIHTPKMPSLQLTCQLKYILCTVRGCKVFLHVGHFLVAFKHESRHGLQKTCLQHPATASVMSNSHVNSLPTVSLVILKLGLTPVELSKNNQMHCVTATAYTTLPTMVRVLQELGQLPNASHCNVPRFEQKTIR